jgi:streptomycin 6-kinase
VVEIPARVREFALRRGDEGIAWLACLPTLVAECVDQWQLQLGATIPASFSFVAQVQRENGTPAVLKVTFPEAESRHEAEGLRRWNGDGIVLLYEADVGRNALLLERLEPGTPLREHADEREALAIACDLLQRLWRPVEPAAPYERLSELAPEWAESTLRLFANVQPPFPPALAQHASALLRNLGSSQGDQVLVHRDFHRGNILAARREPWLAIDPKPTIAEREFDAAWLLGSNAGTAEWLLDELSARLGLDRDRLHAWGIARYVLGGLWTYADGGDGADALAIADTIRAA